MNLRSENEILDQLISEKKYDQAEECQKNIDEIKSQCSKIENEISNIVNPASAIRFEWFIVVTIKLVGNVLILTVLSDLVII